MAQKIYKVFFVKFREPWYQLSKTEQDALLQKVGDALTTAGGKNQGLYSSGWSTEIWQGFGIEMFPNLEAVQHHTRLLEELNWFRYVESFSALGTEMPM